VRCAADRRGRAALVLAAACLAGFVAGCSPVRSAVPSSAPPAHVFSVGGPGGGFLFVPGSARARGRPPISVGPVPPASSDRAINLPLNGYADVASLDQTALSEADALLTQQCMTSRGFVYTAQAPPAQIAALMQDTEYAFGLTSQAQAAAFGYRQPRSAVAVAASPAFLGGFATFGDLARQQRAWTIALLGFAPGARVGSVRQPGCLQQTESQLYGARGALADPVPAIAVQASTWTQSDPRIQTLDARWSRCMAARGFRYGNPEQPADAQWPARPSSGSTEIRTAEADVACKQQVNFAHTWLAVEAAYQSALIGQDQSTLSGLQASFGRMLRRAEALLSLPARAGAR
jgi:hypothetical protein